VEKAVTALIDSVNVAIATGNVEPYESLTTDDCSCRALTASVKEKFAGAAKSQGAEWSLESVRVEKQTRTRAEATITYRSAAYENMDQEGSVYQEFPATRSDSAVYFRWIDGRWLAEDFDVLSKKEVDRP
jgi:hypothetical protein